MFNRTNTKKFEITAPPSNIAEKLQHPPPALLVRPSYQEQQRYVNVPVQRYPSDPEILKDPQHTKKKHEKSRSQTPNHYKEEKKKKKKFLSVFRKKNDSVEQDGRQSEPLTRRPHSATSDHKLLRHGSSRSTKSTEYLTEDDGSNYPNSRQPKLTPTHAPRPHNSQRATSEPATYDALENYRLDRQANSKEPVGRSHSYTDQYSGPKASLKLTPQPTPPGSVASSDSRSTVPKVDDHTPSLLSSIPGVVGIKNHGNTCFINAILQCLSNTEPLLFHFLSNKYQEELRTEYKSNGASLPGGSPAHSRVQSKPPSEGVLDPEGVNIVTQHFGFLLKALWSSQYEARISAIFKEVVGIKSEQYRGRNQHDAQEFLLWLLDQLHEDLNQATGCMPICSKVLISCLHASNTNINYQFM